MVEERRVVIIYFAEENDLVRLQCCAKVSQS